MDRAGQSNTTVYVWSVVGLAIGLLVFVVAITAIRPAQDNTALIVQGVGFVLPVMMALLAVAIQQTHKSVNSRVDEMEERIQQAEAAKGDMKAERARAEGIESERQRAPTPPTRRIGDVH